MRSGGNNFNYFPENKLTKLANFVQFIRMLMFCPEDLGEGAALPFLGYATAGGSASRSPLWARTTAVAIGPCLPVPRDTAG